MNCEGQLNAVFLFGLFSHFDPKVTYQTTIILIGLFFYYEPVREKYEIKKWNEVVSRDMSPLIWFINDFNRSCFFLPWMYEIHAIEYKRHCDRAKDMSLSWEAFKTNQQSFKLVSGPKRRKPLENRQCCSRVLKEKNTASRRPKPNILEFIIHP